MTKHLKSDKVWKKKDNWAGSTLLTDRTDFTAFLCSYTSPDTEDYLLHRNASNSGKKNISVEYGISLRLLMLIQ